MIRKLLVCSMILGSCLLFAGCGSDDASTDDSDADVPQMGDVDDAARPGTGVAEESAAELMEADE
ncbi:MAG: hypothetical protein IH944_03915 [Armatimonadetes bacterium]|nr:hypothetical protein [Armatimonadota bacterium]